MSATAASQSLQWADAATVPDEVALDRRREKEELARAAEVADHAAGAHAAVRLSPSVPRAYPFLGVGILLLNALLWVFFFAATS